MAANRSELLRLFRSIQEHAGMAITVLEDDRNQDEREIEKEVVFDAAAIDTRLGQVRGQFPPDRPKGGHLRALDRTSAA